MKNNIMKSLLTSILVVATVMMSSFAQPSTIDDVIGAIRSGDADELSKYFDDNIELTLPVKSDSYSKAQAQVILKKVEELTATLNASVMPPDVKIVPYYDRTELIEETTKTVERHLLYAMVLVMAVYRLL